VSIEYAFSHHPSVGVVHGFRKVTEVTRSGL
jgi:hypothetical protein